MHTVHMQFMQYAYYCTVHAICILQYSSCNIHTTVQCMQYAYYSTVHAICILQYSACNVHTTVQCMQYAYCTYAVHVICILYSSTFYCPLNMSTECVKEKKKLNEAKKTTF